MATFLTDDQKTLLELATIKVIDELNMEKSSEAVKTAAFDHYSGEMKEVYQVQVIVTRWNPDFMGAFDMEVIN